MIRSDRERAVVMHLHEREAMFDQNCFRLSNDIADPADFSCFDMKGPSTLSYGGGWESEDDDGISKKVYTIEKDVGSVKLQGIWREGFKGPEYESSVIYH